MMNWIIENFSTMIVSLVLICLVGLVLRKMIKDKRRGVTACGTSCNGCAMAGSCKEIQKK